MGDTINTDAQSEKIADTIRKADLMQLSFILRSEAFMLKYGTPFWVTSQQKHVEPSVRNIKPIDCDIMHRFLILVADNLQDKAMKGVCSHGDKTYSIGV